MSKIVKILLSPVVVMMLWGCVVSEELPKRPSDMTMEERDMELRRMLGELGITLPDNWADMTRQERGEFLLKGNIIPPEVAPAFE